MNFLNKVKAECKERVFAIYSDLADDLDSFSNEKADWEFHFSQMGGVLFEIEKAKTIPELIKALLSEDLVILGCETEEDIDELFTRICEK